MPLIVLLVDVDGTDNDDNRIPSHAVSFTSTIPVITLPDNVYADAVLYARLWKIPRLRTDIVFPEITCEAGNPGFAP